MKKVLLIFAVLQLHGAQQDVLESDQELKLQQALQALARIQAIPQKEDAAPSCVVPLIESSEDLASLSGLPQVRLIQREKQKPYLVPRRLPQGIRPKLPPLPQLITSQSQSHIVAQAPIEQSSVNASTPGPALTADQMNLDIVWPQVQQGLRREIRDNSAWYAYIQNQANAGNARAKQTLLLVK